MNTPRTDAVRDAINCDSMEDNFSTWYNHGCQLETELKVAQAELATTKRHWIEDDRDLNALEKELAEVKSELAALKQSPEAKAQQWLDRRKEIQKQWKKE